MSEKYYRMILWMIMLAALGGILFILLTDISKAIPNTIYLKAQSDNRLHYDVPLSGVIERQYTDGSVETVVTSGGGIAVDFSEEVEIHTAQAGSYLANLKLFGLIPFKTVAIEVLGEKQLYPVGETVGIYVKTEGVLVIATSDFVSSQKEKVYPTQGLLRKGDYITKVNGEPVTGKRQFVERVDTCDGQSLLLTVRRNDTEFEREITPVKNEEGSYKLGIWIRDSTQGIGTITYVDADGNYGALGHGISDMDIGTLMELSEGEIYQTQIIGIHKGEKGKPGELCGIIRYRDSEYLGTVNENEESGIHGTLEIQKQDDVKRAYDIGLGEDIHEGPAQMISDVSGNGEYYDIEITQVQLAAKEENKRIMIRITDRRLLDLTGGIVQGMCVSYN